MTIDKNYCRHCDSYRPIDHIYCYVCGAELKLVDHSLKDKNNVCPICKEPFEPNVWNQIYCKKELCQKLASRIHVSNYFRRKRGLDNIIWPEPRKCKICSNDIPPERLTNSRIITCSAECSRELNNIRASNFYYKHFSKEYKYKVCVICERPIPVERSKHGITKTCCKFCGKVRHYNNNVLSEKRRKEKKNGKNTVITM